ncbi:Thaumatin-like protein 1a [Linum grandiflorum]
MAILTAILLSLATVTVSVQSTTLTFTNNCPFTIWPGTLTGGGAPQLSTTGFELASNAVFRLNNVPPGWSSGRLWARTHCTTDSAGKFSCLTGDCASGQHQCNGAGAIPPVTLVEFTLNGHGGLDYYDVSLVDGFNLPVSVAPDGIASGSANNICKSTSCSADVNAVCPRQLAVTNGASGSVVACKSACLALNEPKYCCSGEFNTPEKCPATEYSKVFKDKCPEAYSYAYDDLTSTFTCPTGPAYVVTFCP